MAEEDLKYRSKLFDQETKPKATTIGTESPFYRSVTGNRTAINLDIRKNTGDRRGFNYAYLTSPEFNKSQGITLHFTDAKVIIEGRNLEPLYDRLLEHQVIYIAEAKHTDSFVNYPEHMLVVEKITISNA